MADESLLSITAVDATADMPQREIIYGITVVEQVDIPMRECLGYVCVVEATNEDMRRCVLCNDLVSMSNQTKQAGLYIAGGNIYVLAQPNMSTSQIVI